VKKKKLEIERKETREKNRREIAPLPFSLIQLRLIRPYTKPLLNPTKNNHKNHHCHCFSSPSQPPYLQTTTINLHRGASVTPTAPSPAK